jgi:hypothetical protein
MEGTVLVHHKPGHFNGPPVVPEPGPALLLMLGLIGLALITRRR